MNCFLSATILALVMGSEATASASSPATVESTLNQYCEPLIAGSTAAEITKSAQASGFKSDQIGGQPVLVFGELILGLSDAPRVCLVQAPPVMTFAQGISFVEAWASQYPGATQGAATKGPDGAPVRLWAVPKEKKYLLVTEQTNARGQKVLNFILAPLPGS